jgi:glycine cleavage system transcriptional repressor
MAVLAGEFAFMALISGESRSLANISRESMDLGTGTGLNIWVKLPSGKKPVEPSLPYKLVASCMDHPGVVYRISSTLSAAGVNIESMDTQTYAAPVSGTPIFRLEALLTVPAGLNINKLRESLAEIEREENIDLDLALQGE